MTANDRKCSKYTKTEITENNRKLLKVAEMTKNYR